jgi:hypothetical protein
MNVLPAHGHGHGRQPLHGFRVLGGVAQADGRAQGMADDGDGMDNAQSLDELV